MPKPPTAAQWNQHRDLITDLYVNQAKKQKEVAEYMRRWHNFYATEKMFISRFIKWSINKKKSVEDAQAIMQALERTNSAGQKPSEVRLRGGKVTLQEARASLKRRRRRSAALRSTAASSRPSSSTLSVIYDGGEDAWSRSVDLEDERYGEVAADYASSRRPATVALVGIEQYEVFFIQKMRDWLWCDKYSSCLPHRSAAFFGYLGDLRHQIRLPTTTENYRLRWMIRQLGPIFEQEFVTGDPRLMSDLIVAADYFENAPVHQHDLIRNIKATIFRIIEEKLSGKTSHPLFILCSLLFNYGRIENEWLLGRMLHHCSQLSQERLGEGSIGHQRIECVRYGILRRRCDWQGAEDVLQHLVDLLCRGSQEQQVMAYDYKTKLAVLYLHEGKLSRAEATCLETIEYCRQTAQQQGLPIARMQFPLPGMYDNALHCIYATSEKKHADDEAESWARERFAHCREAFGAYHTATLRAMYILLECLRSSGKCAEADAIEKSWKDILDPPELADRIEEVDESGKSCPQRLHDADGPKMKPVTEDRDDRDEEQ